MDEFKDPDYDLKELDQHHAHDDPEVQARCKEYGMRAADVQMRLYENHLLRQVAITGICRALHSACLILVWWLLFYLARQLWLLLK